MPLRISLDIAVPDFLFGILVGIAIVEVICRICVRQSPVESPQYIACNNKHSPANRTASVLPSEKVAGDCTLTSLSTIEVDSLQDIMSSLAKKWEKAAGSVTPAQATDDAKENSTEQTTEDESSDRKTVSCFIFLYQDQLLIYPPFSITPKQSLGLLDHDFTGKQRNKIGNLECFLSRSTSLEAGWCPLVPKSTLLSHNSRNCG